MRHAAILGAIVSNFRELQVRIESELERCIGSEQTLFGNPAWVMTIPQHFYWTGIKLCYWYDELADKTSNLPQRDDAFTNRNSDGLVKLLPGDIQISRNDATTIATKGVTLFINGIERLTPQDLEKKLKLSMQPDEQTLYGALLRILADSWEHLGCARSTADSASM
jgi:hypothetical protein